MTKSNDVDLKGIGLVPPGIIKIYKDLILCYLTHGFTDKKTFFCIQGVIDKFLTIFDIENFLEPNSKGELVYKLKLKNNELEVIPDNVQKISRGFSVKDIDIIHYYKMYIENWVQTIIINSQV